MDRGLALLLFPRPGEFGWREFHAGLDEFSILRDGEIGILVFVVDDPALALGDDFVAELGGGEIVSPLRNAPSVNFWMLPLWTSVTDLSLLSRACWMAMRTRRLVPVMKWA